MAPISYRRHRFPPVVVQHAVWLYLRFTLSYRDVEELHAERGLDLSYESVRSWVLKFGPAIARRLRRCSIGRADRPAPVANCRSRLAWLVCPRCKAVIHSLKPRQPIPRLFQRCLAFACAVLQHLAAPLAALKEIRRVLKPRGVIGIVDGSSTITFRYPTNPLLEAWDRLRGARTQVQYGPRVGCAGAARSPPRGRLCSDTSIRQPGR
jgi:hypothetical protein